MKKILICTLALTLCTPGLAMPSDGKFTIAAIPDTQNYMDYTHQTAEGFPFAAVKNLTGFPPSRGSDNPGQTSPGYLEQLVTRFHLLVENIL